MYIKPTLSSFLTKLKSNRGFSITEVMVTSGLVAIVGVGATNLISNMQKEQRRNALQQVLTSKKLQFENSFTNTSSWMNTLASNPSSMACLSNQQACGGTAWSGYSLTYPQIKLQDGASSPVNGNTFYDGTGADGSKMGFTETGTVCNTFTTAAAGNDACPIGYRVSWAPHSTTGVNPKITVYAKLIYNPSDASPFKTFINAPPSSTSINQRYDATLDRTATSTSKAFMVRYTKITSAAGCASSGYGTCTTGSYSTYGTTFGTMSIATDVFQLLDSSVTTAVRIKEVGSYKCNAKAYAFATNSANLQIYRTNNSPALLAGPVSGFASSTTMGYTTLIMDSVIVISQPNTDIVLQHQCENAGAAQCSTGFASSTSYSATIPSEIASLNCVKVD